MVGRSDGWAGGRTVFGAPRTALRAPRLFWELPGLSWELPTLGAQLLQVRPVLVRSGLLVETSKGHEDDTSVSERLLNNQRKLVWHP